MTGVSGDGVIGTGLAGNLVEFIEINDAVFGLFHVLVRSVVEVADSDFYVSADEAGFRQAGSVGYGKGNV